MYRYGYRPASPLGRPGDAEVSTRVLLLRALLNLLVACVVYLNGADLMARFLGDTFGVRHVSAPYAIPVLLLENIPFVLIAVMVFGRMGRWREVWRRFGAPVLAGATTEERVQPAPAEEVPERDVWRALRAGGQLGAAQRLDQETAAGLVTDVDYVRIHRVYQDVLAEPRLVGAFGEQVAGRGAAACAHPSEARDLPVRVAEHDLLVGQVRLGTAQDVPKNSAAHRGAGFALDQQVLGTSLLAVGPAGTGKTARLARPVAEALCLQALARTACVVVIGAAEAELGPDGGYDVVIAPGDPSSAYGLDLYGVAHDPDEAAARLADALLPDELALRAESARIALQQVVGPFHAGYGRYPTVRELRALLGGDPQGWEALLKALGTAGRLTAYESDVQHRQRQHGRADDPGCCWRTGWRCWTGRPSRAASTRPRRTPSRPSRCARWSIRCGCG